MRAKHLHVVFLLVNDKENENFKRLEDVVTIFREQNLYKKTALELVLYYLVHWDNERGVHPEYAKYEQKKFFEKLDKLFEETGIKP